MSIVRLLPEGSWTPARPDAPERLAEAERRLGRSLPTDVRELYLACDRVTLLDDLYTFLPLDELAPLAKVQMDDESEDFAPQSWIAIIDLQDGNYVGLDLVPEADGSYKWLDCFHETIGEAEVIAASLSEFLTSAMAHPDGQFWLEPGRPVRRTLRYENPPSYHRRMDAGFYASLGDELGPETCTTEACRRKRIALSVKCRRHHYEMSEGRPSPFDDD